MPDTAEQLTLEQYLARIRPQLYGPFWSRRRVGEEVRCHLEEAIERLQEQGLDHREATRLAIERFGPPTLVARSFAEAKGVGAATWFTRRTGLGAAFGAVVLAVASVAQELSEAFRHGAFAETSVVCLGLVGAGALAVYRRTRGHLGRPGRIGFQLMIGGFLAGWLSGLLWFPPGGVASLVVMLVGIGLYLAAVLRSAVLPRGALVLLACAAGAAVVVGTAGSITGTDTGPVATAAAAILGAAGMVWVGSFLWCEVDPDGQRGLLPVGIV